MAVHVYIYKDLHVYTRTFFLRLGNVNMIILRTFYGS